MTKHSSGLLDPWYGDNGTRPEIAVAVAAPVISERIGGNGDDEFFAFGNGAVRYLGGGGDDFLMGAKGNDFLNGQAGNDRVSGGAGDDKVKGGSGDDIVAGGKGDDKMSGGHGADTYLFSPHFGHDKVTDFHHGHDNFNLVEALREDGSLRLHFSDIKISYDHQEHEAIIRTPAGKIEVLDFHGTLHHSDFVL
jgi:Ca2+-binding RTX toxin-like protein